MPEQTPTLNSSDSYRTRMQWRIAVGAVVAAVSLVAFGRGALPKPGQTASYAVTVVPADARGLACASDMTISGHRCGFDAQSRPVTVDRPLRPFVTLGRELLLLSGVFESHNVAAWLGAALKRGDEARVTIECRARNLGVMSTVSVHWAPEGAFQPEQAVMVADVEDCSVKH